ncbi:MAG TPA: pitrilysin family protein, partial [Candidatus Wallbacteria bacterium]|nr:pitrilysin family protein [Candidatus Wallbacteria bacterium]
MFNIALIQPQSFELTNGLQLTLAGDFDRSRPYCAIVFLAKCGLYTETEENNGITHALEHILFKGSRKYSNYDITSIINSRGGSIDAFTTSDSLGIEIIIPPRHLGDALEVLSQLALKPAFPESEIELEKKVIIEEMRFYRDDPEDLVMLKLEKACYKGSCYSREILGTKKSVSGLTKKNLADYHRDYFTPSNCTLTIAGSFDAQNVLRVVERHFGAEEWPASSSPAKNTDYALAQNSNESYFIRRRGKFTQNYYAIGFTTPSSLKNEHIYSMFLPYVFSSLKSSPLLYTLKDEYNAVNSMTTDLVFKYGMWMITVLASYSPARSGAVKSAIGNFMANASRFVSEKYFESIKKCFLLDYMQEIENPRTYCGELSTFNHILGAGSYNYVVKALLDLKYENFIQYLRAHVETSLYKRVELISAPAKKRENKTHPVTSLIERINNFNSTHPAAGGNCGPYILKKRSGSSTAATEIIKIDERSSVCCVADPKADYSTLALFIKGGVSSSFKPGDANMLAELFGRKTAGASMYENYMLSDSRGIYFDCNSFLDYF